MRVLKVAVFGPLTIVDGDGVDRTPMGAKTRAIVALLICSPEHRRSRAWLQDKLWSDRGQPQAAGSLRQALTELRKSFGPYRNVILSDKNNVSLDPSKIEVDWQQRNDSELFEDLNIKDPEFTDWIRDRRLEMNEPSDGAGVTQRNRRAADKPLLLLSLDEPLSGPAEYAANLLKHTIATHLLEEGVCAIADCAERIEPGHIKSASMLLRVRPHLQHDSVQIFLTLEDVRSGRLLWSRVSRGFPIEPSDEGLFEVFRFSSIACECIENAAPNYDNAKDICALQVAAFAKSRLFDFSRKGLLESDNVLAAAYEVEPRGSFLAWRGFIRATARFEFLNDRFLEKLHDDELFVESLASDPRNSYSRTFAAQHYYIGGESPTFSKLLLSEAIETNKLNTLAWGFMANAEILSGDPSRALEYAKRGFSLSQNYLERGFLGLLVCMAATACERYDEAEKFADFAAHFSPNLVPAKRYRFALSLRKGDCSKIQKTMQDMRAFEPDFDAKRLMDPGYPVKTMQSLPIMESVVAAA